MRRMQADVSQFVQMLILQALKNAIEKDNGGIGRRQLANKNLLEPLSGAWAVLQVVATFYRTVRRGDFIKHNCAPLHFILLLKVCAPLRLAPRILVGEGTD